MAEKPTPDAPDAHHAEAVSKIMQVLIDDTVSAGGDVGEMMNILVSVIACTVLNLFREDSIANTLKQMNRQIGPRISAVRAQNVEVLAKLEAATRAHELKKEGKLN